MRNECNDGSYLRPIEIADFIFFAECMVDWPEDHEGLFSMQRAMQVLTKHIRHSKEFHYPLTDTSKFNLVMVYCNVSDEAVGYRRVKIDGKVVHVGQEVIHPKFRGQGLSKKQQAAWHNLIRDVMEADELTWEVMADTSPQTAHTSERFVKRDIGTRTGSTGQNVTRHAMTKEEFKQFTDSPAAVDELAVQWTFNPNG